MDINNYIIQHAQHNRFKQLSNLNSIRFSTVFGQKGVNIVGITACKKFNINLNHIKSLNKNKLMNYIHYLYLNNMYI
jgi:hypothetical protein